jgi:UPF0755 protein
MKPNKRLIFFLLFSVLGISFSYYAFQIVYTPNILLGQKNRLFVVEDTMTFSDVQRKMHDDRIVNDLISFSFLARITGYDEEIKPGRYILKAGMNNIETLKLLRSGQQEPVKITFNNVRVLSELSAKITKNLSMDADEFESAVIKFAKSNPYGFNRDNVMTMFIPNTYEVYYNTSAENLIDKMHDEYVKFWDQTRKDKARAIGYSPIDVAILASIVQAESIQEDEASIIAGLYINRLQKGIALQADPTLVFAVGDFSLKRVLNEHKEIDSPYNTYKYPGLPPGPINMPEIKSVDAVLNYKPNNYYYMCAKEDFSGRHNFTNSYAEHLRNAARYQQALTIEQRKGAALRAKENQR